MKKMATSPECLNLSHARGRVLEVGSTFSISRGGGSRGEEKRFLRTDNGDHGRGGCQYITSASCFRYEPAASSGSPLSPS
jgi:hypothetical protein